MVTCALHRRIRSRTEVLHTSADSYAPTVESIGTCAQMRSHTSQNTLFSKAFSVTYLPYLCNLAAKVMLFFRICKFWAIFLLEKKHTAQQIVWSASLARKKERLIKEKNQKKINKRKKAPFCHFVLLSQKSKMEYTQSPKE